MNQTDKGNSITKAELESISDKYRQQRYDACLRAVSYTHLTLPTT